MDGLLRHSSLPRPLSSTPIAYVCPLVIDTLVTAGHPPKDLSCGWISGCTPDNLIQWKQASFLHPLSLEGGESALTLDDHPKTLIEIHRHGPAVLAKVKLGAGQFLFSLQDTTGPQVRYIVSEEISHTLQASLVDRHPDVLLDHPLLKRADYSINKVTSADNRSVARIIVDLQCASATALQPNRLKALL